MRENNPITRNHYKSVLGRGSTIDNETFDGLIKKKPAFVKFYSIHCGHCRSMAVAWKALGEHGNGVEGLGIYVIEVDVDGLTSINSVCKEEEGLKAGVPYIALVNKDGTVFKEYRGDRSAGDMKKFIKENGSEFIKKNGLDAKSKNNKNKVVGGGNRKQLKNRTRRNHTKKRSKRNKKRSNKTNKRNKH